MIMQTKVNNLPGLGTIQDKLLHPCTESAKILSIFLSKFHTLCNVTVIYDVQHIIKRSTAGELLEFICFSSYHWL